MKIKILESDQALQGKILNLQKIDEMVYRDEKTGLIFLDCWDEIEAIKRYSTEKHFYDLHLFTDGGSELKFITEIEVIK